MSPFVIFEILFLVGAAIGTFAHFSGKTWGVGAALLSLIMFGVLVTIAGVVR
jgi:arginine exporter protein ArgO